MIQHLVMLTFKPETDHIDELERRLGTLPAVVPEIRQYDFGRDILCSERSFDFGLVSAFEDLEALQRYQKHPRHQEVLQLIGRICDSVHVVDFELRR